MATKIIQTENPILRQTSTPVKIADITMPKIGKVIKDMKKALEKEDDGVAIAAPQIGENLRIFVVSGRALAMIKAGMEDTDEVLPDETFINPEIVKISKKKKLIEEGCLSVRWLYGKVERSDKVVVRAYDEYGKKFERGGAGLLAQIFQHEIDHLDGILFIDKAIELESLPPNEK